MGKTTDMAADFQIIVEYNKQGSPTKALRAFSSIIEAFEKLDNDLVGSIDTKIKPITVLENIKIGSIEGWLKNVLESVDDDALKELSWKKAVGSYLVKAKYLVVDFMNQKTEITDRKDVLSLEKELYELAQQTDVKRFPAYRPIPTKNLVSNLKNISESVKGIDDGRVTFTSLEDNKTTDFNLTIDISPENIMDLMTKEQLESTQNMILKVKKPDYLGDSRWELRHEKKSISAKIDDVDWLKDFQDRKIDVRPGDSLKAKVQVTVKYDFNMEVIGSEYVLLEVLEIIKGEGESQLMLQEE